MLWRCQRTCVSCVWRLCLVPCKPAQHARHSCKSTHTTPATQHPSHHARLITLTTPHQAHHSRSPAAHGAAALTGIRDDAEHAQLHDLLDRHRGGLTRQHADGLRGGRHEEPPSGVSVTLSGMRVAGKIELGEQPSRELGASRSCNAQQLPERTHIQDTSPPLAHTHTHKTCTALTVSEPGG